MDYTYHIIPEHRLIVEEVRGEVTITELARKMEKLFADPLYRKDYAGLADFRGAVSRLTNVELYAFAELVNETDKFGEARWAILAADPIVVALGQLFKQRVRNAENVEVFATAEAAAGYLELPAALEYVNDEAVS